MNNVLTLRTKFAMTQDDFSELCGVSRISIARYETGGKISRDNAEKIAKACHVSVSYVLGDTNNDAEPETDDIWVMRERLRRDPSYRLLFDAASTATPEHLRAAAAMLKALEGTKID